MPKHTKRDLNNKKSNPICAFCSSDKTDELKFGELKKLENVNVHYFCMLLSSGLSQNGEDEEGILGFLLKDIKAEIQRGRKLKCYYCKRNGATIGCSNNRCLKKFHLPCALEERSLHQFYGAFPSYCEKHKPLQELTSDDKDNFFKGKNNVCAICLFPMEKLCGHSIIRAPCCKNAYLHRSCVQQQALNAGYFFRCPLCNNKESFQQEMLQFGIFIPQRDATWELEANAYQDLLFRHDTCDAEVCLCPDGRNFSNSGSRWEIILCNSCGSNGSHVKCGKLKWLKQKWECKNCLNVQKPQVPKVPKRKKKIMGTTRILLKKCKLDTDSDTDTSSEVDVVNIDNSGNPNPPEPIASNTNRYQPQIIQLTDSEDDVIEPNSVLHSLLIKKSKILNEKSPESLLKPERIFQPFQQQMENSSKKIGYVNLVSDDEDDEKSEVRSEVDPGFNYDSSDELESASKKMSDIDQYSWLDSMGINDEPDTEIWVPETDRRYEFYSRTGASGVKIVVLTTDLSSSDDD